MFNAIGVITRAQLMIVRNTLWRGKPRRKVAWVFLAVVLGFVAFGIYSLMGAAVSFIQNPDFIAALREAAARSPGTTIPLDFHPYLVALPSIALFIALVMLVLTSFSTVLSSLYLSGDIDMLLVAPVPMRAVFVVKFFGGLVLPYLLLFLLLGPALLGFGQGMGYGPVFYVAAILALLLLPLLPFSIGALLVMAVVRVIPARRAREIVGVLGGMIGIAWYILSQFSRQIGTRVSGAQTLGLLERLNNPLLPSAWAGRALIAAGEGEWAVFLALGSLFALVSVGAFAGALILGERIYYEGWSNMATQGGKTRKHQKTNEARRTEPFSLRPLTFLLPPESAAILYKDLRVFPRDLRNIQQLIFPLVVAAIWVFNLVSNGRGSYAWSSQVSSAFDLLFPVGISAFICLTLSTALGGSNISREGKGFWQLKIAPISSWRLLLGKFVLAYAPYPIVGTLFIALISVLQHSRIQDALIAWAILLLTGLGVCAIALGLGAAFPKFDWVNPNQQRSVRAGCLSPLCYMLYLGLTVGAVLGMPLLGTFFPAFGLALTILGWAVAIALTAGVVWGFMAFGAYRLDQVEV